MKNFGKIKNAVTNLLANSILKENNKDKNTVKKYLSEVKKNDILKKQYIVYSNIEEAHIPDRTAAFDFIKENVAYLDEYHPQSIINENIKFTKKLTDDVNQELKEQIEYQGNENLKELHENITELIHTKNTPSNLEERNKLISKIADFVQNNEKKELNEDTELIKDQNIPSDVLIKFATDKFNKKYSNLDESEKKIVKTIINDKEDEKKEVFKNIRGECIEEIDNTLEEGEDKLELKDKLLKAKQKLLEMEYNPETFSTDMNKMLKLKK